jgi:hypothetical protein
MGSLRFNSVLIFHHFFNFNISQVGNATLVMAALDHLKHEGHFGEKNNRVKRGLDGEGTEGMAKREREDCREGVLREGG